MAKTPEAFGTGIPAILLNKHMGAPFMPPTTEIEIKTTNKKQPEETNNKPLGILSDYSL